MWKETCTLYYLIFPSRIINIIFLNLVFFLFADSVSPQSILSADPNQVIMYEHMIYNRESNNVLQTVLRPQFYYTRNKWSLRIINEIFYNSGAPNLDNMSNRLIGKGLGTLNGINLFYSGKSLIFSMQPYYSATQNKEIDELSREGPFTKLNDFRQIDKTPYIKYSLRETQIYFTYQEFGFGFSNANMWWGPGIHTSLTMTNNTSGFPYLMIGTIREKRIGNIGFNFRYIYSQLNKTANQPHFTAFTFISTFYNDPIISIGFNRNILSSNRNNNGRIIKFSDVAANVFLPLSRSSENYQILASYFIIDFPNSGLKVFFEFGTTDKWQNFDDFLNYPDHGIGSIFGFRQYGPFNNNKLVMGFEYARLVQSSFWEKRPTQDWYGNPIFDYSSYDGRRWAAHSGSDSDDLYIYFGYQSNEWAFLPSFNYERHGVLYKRPAEVKMEIRLDFRYKLNDYWFNILFEREWLEHAGFVSNKWRNSNVIWFGIERDITNKLSNKIGLVKSN